MSVMYEHKQARTDMPNQIMRSLINFFPYALTAISEWIRVCAENVNAWQLEMLSKL